MNDKIIFLDRDGVINQFPGHGLYVTKLSEFKLLPRSVKAIELLSDKGFKIFVISNQAGVSKGFYTQAQLDEMTDQMESELNKSGGRLAGVFYCTHLAGDDCACRKPKIGNIKAAVKSLGKPVKSLRSSFFVGDSETDILTGYTAGCKTILVLTGHASKKDILSWKLKPDFVAEDLLDAVDIILKNDHSLITIKRANEMYAKKVKVKNRYYK